MYQNEATLISRDFETDVSFQPTARKDLSSEITRNPGCVTARIINRIVDYAVISNKQE